MARREVVYKPLTLKLADIVKDETVRGQIIKLFEEFTDERAKANAAMRQAILAASQAEIASQKSRMAFMQLLIQASEHSEPIRVEQQWTVFQKDGDVIFECPFTEADQRTAIRAQRANMQHTARALGSPVEDFYAGDEEPGEREIGFGARKKADDAEAED